MMASEAMSAGMRTPRPTGVPRIECEPVRHVKLQRMVLDELKLMLHAALKLVAALLIVEGLVWVVAAGPVQDNRGVATSTATATPSPPAQWHASAEFAARSAPLARAAASEGKARAPGN